jgi:hypothetical protein
MTILQYADVFLAEGPDPGVADKLQLFGQFVGSWDVAVTNHRPDRSSETIPPEWHFASALGGRAGHRVRRFAGLLGRVRRPGQRASVAR